MASVRDIRDLVNSYVAGESAADFANRFAPVLRAAIKSQDEAAKKLALAVHAEIAHYFNGFISEEDMRANLEPFADLNQGVPSVSVEVFRAYEPQVATSNPGYRGVVVSDLHAVPMQ